MGVRKHGAAVYRSPQWAALRLLAKRRDGWRCVKCGARSRLEVDHIKPVRTHPELSFDLTNLQTLCATCHSRKTRVEIGLAPNDEPERAAWRELVRAIAHPQPKEVSCSNP